MTGSSADALAGRPLQLVGCGDVAVAAGDVTIDTTEGAATGLDVDRLGLTSLAGGGAVPAGATGSMDAVVAALQPAAPTSQPTVSVVDERPDRVELEVSGLDERSWLVFGQSLSEGWKASSPELGDLGSPTLIQGFANGWELDPTTGTVHITLEWTPQKVVWAGIGISLLGVLACIAILLVPIVLRRRRHTRGAGPAADQPLALDGPDRPGGRKAALLAGGGTAVFAALNLPRDRVLLSLILAVALGVATGAVVRWGRGQNVLGSVAPLALAAAGIYAVTKEWRGNYRSSEWPQIFDPVHVLGVLAVLALVGVAVVNAWRDERGSAAQDDEVTGVGRAVGPSVTRMTTPRPLLRGGGDGLHTLLGPRRLGVVGAGEDPSHRAGHPSRPGLGQFGRRTRPSLVEGLAEQLEPALVVRVGERHQLVHTGVRLQRSPVVAAPPEQLPVPERGDLRDVLGPVDLGGVEHRTEDGVDRGRSVERPHQGFHVVLGEEVAGRRRGRRGRRSPGRWYGEVLAVRPRRGRAANEATLRAAVAVPWFRSALTPRTVVQLREPSRRSSSPCTSQV